MQFTYVTIALFAAVALGAPAAAPTDILDSLAPFEGSISDIGQVDPTGQTKNPVPQRCCKLNSSDKVKCYRWCPWPWW